VCVCESACKHELVVSYSGAGMTSKPRGLIHHWFLADLNGVFQFMSKQNKS